MSYNISAKSNSTPNANISFPAIFVNQTAVLTNVSHSIGTGGNSTTTPLSMRKVRATEREIVRSKREGGYVDNREWNRHNQTLRARRGVSHSVLPTTNTGNTTLSLDFPRSSNHNKADISKSSHAVTAKSSTIRNKTKYNETSHTLMREYQHDLKAQINGSLNNESRFFDNKSKARPVNASEVMLVKLGIKVDMSQVKILPSASLIKQYQNASFSMDHEMQHMAVKWLRLNVPVNTTAIKVQLNLSSLYMNGDLTQNISKDDARGLRHLIKAATLGGENLCAQIAEYYLNKANATVDDKAEALRWLINGAARSEQGALASLESHFPSTSSLPNSKSRLVLDEVSSQPSLTKDGEFTDNGTTVVVWADKRKVPSAAVLNGKAMRFDECPYIAYVDDRCTGVIVSNDQILTAAHCLSKDGKGMTIYHGDVDKEKMKANKTQQYEVVKIERLMHPNGSASDVDLVLLTVNRPFPNTSAMLRLPSHRDWRHFSTDVEKNSAYVVGQHSIRNSNVKIVGWGSENYGGSVPDVVKYTDMAAISSSNCAYLTKTPNVKNSQKICVRTNEDGAVKGGCHGDSGGPMLWLDVRKGKEVFVGIFTTEHGKCTLGSGVNLAVHTQELSRLLHKNATLPVFTGTQSSLAQYHKEFVTDSHSTSHEFRMNLVNLSPQWKQFSVQYDSNGVRSHDAVPLITANNNGTMIIPKGASNIVVKGFSYINTNLELEMKFQVRSKYINGKQGATLYMWGDGQKSQSWEMYFN